MPYSGERFGFKSREAAEMYQIANSIEPAWSCTYTKTTCVRERLSGAWGRIHTYKRKAKCKDGQYREFYGSYVGA